MIVFLYKVIMGVMALYYTLMPAVERGLMRVWLMAVLFNLNCYVVMTSLPGALPLQMLSIAWLSSAILGSSSDIQGGRSNDAIKVAFH